MKDKKSIFTNEFIYDNKRPELFVYFNEKSNITIGQWVLSKPTQPSIMIKYTFDLFVSTFVFIEFNNGSNAS